MHTNTGASQTTSWGGRSSRLRGSFQGKLHFNFSYSHMQWMYPCERGDVEISFGQTLADNCYCWSHSGDMWAPKGSGFFISESVSLMLLDPSIDIVPFRTLSIILKNLVQVRKDTSVRRERFHRPFFNFCLASSK